MADVKVTIDEAAVRALFSDWDGPVGDAIERATREVEDTAKILAPVSPTGSKLSPPGALKASTRQSLERHYDDNGFCMGLVGAPRMPYNPLANPTSHKGWTWNRGRHSTRPGDNNYLDEALNSVPFQTYFEW